MDINTDNKTKKSIFFILRSSGDEVDIQSKKGEEIRIQNDHLNRVIMSVIGGEKSLHFSSHMDTVQKLNLADYEPSSDKGNFRFYPNGALIRNLIVKWCDSIASDVFNAFPIITPFLYKSNIPAVQKQIGIFKDSVYYIETPGDDQEYVLRFNDDLGLFEIMKDAQFLENQLPLRIYEHTPSLRYNPSGSLSGIRRARSFSFTDIHSFCKNEQQGIEEYLKVDRLFSKIAEESGLCLCTHFKITKHQYPSMKRMMIEMLGGKDDMLVELIPAQRQYWSMKHITYTNHPQKIFHIQFDSENSERFSVKYSGNDGKLKNCIIIHSSLGSIEKWIILAIEEALKLNSPTLPLWLCPTQVRVLPISGEKHLERSIAIANELKSNEIRVDVDDRAESLGKKIRLASKEWIPYILVCGDKELNDEIFPIRMRREEMQKQMELSKLVKMIKEHTNKKPFQPLPGLLLSKRPVFRGSD